MNIPISSTKNDGVFRLPDRPDPERELGKVDSINGLEVKILGSAVMEKKN